ncbi:trypsin-like peptidase domain-containing protein [Schlesneria sp. T3-172]|uniref:S1 family peptidase n=1 Tax=Schlesneria sphaerica TaxID=3373610 RepID=UPI0037CB0AFF
MRRWTTILSCLLLATLISVVTGWQQVRPMAVAQVPRNNKSQNGTISDKGATSPVADADSVEDYPEFLVDEIIVRLTTATMDLIEQKKSRTTKELRPELDRTHIPLNLPAPATTPLSTVELYRRATQSVFLVAGITRPTEEETSWQTSFSTAFAVHPDGILATSAHVFDHEDPDDAVVVMDIHGTIYPVLELLAADRDTDTCIFRIEKKNLTPLPLKSKTPPGSAIRVIGHPGDSFFYFSAGYIANYERDENEILWMNVTADFGQGSSGGPVMDEAGNVVGQVSRTFTLYAGGDTSTRGIRRAHPSRQKTETETAPGDADTPDHQEQPDRADPQMVFKACTPAASIRSLTK